MSSKSKKKLGDAWAGPKSRDAYSNGSLKSINVSKKKELQVAFRNESETPLKLCWVDKRGVLHKYYSLKPIENTIIDDERFIGNGLHIETTYLGDAFVFLLCDDSDPDSSDSDSSDSDSSSSDDSDSDTDETASSSDDTDSVNDDGNNEEGENASPYPPSTSENITPSSNSQPQSSRSSSQPRSSRSVDINRIVGGYRPRKSPSKDSLDIVTISQNYDDDNEWYVNVRRCKIDTTPPLLDTSNKKYNSITLGGWPVKCDDDWDDCDAPAETEALRKRIIDDLSAAASHLPPAARDQLRRSTTIYINKNLRYGHAAAPMMEDADEMCFHESPEWLEENGMAKEKAGHVEIFRAKEYLGDCDSWGPGGVMLHELSHAYHFHHVPDGFKNEEVKKCYEAAMKEGLYDCVKVRGEDKPERRGYACEDECEYFAELSVAFLGGVNDDEEYNKWFPFNRTQLKNHDPRAYELLRRLWKVDF